MSAMFALSPAVSLYACATLALCPTLAILVMSTPVAIVAICSGVNSLREVVNSTVIVACTFVIMDAMSTPAPPSPI